MADQDKQLDHLLDSLLADYADAEPRPGFETRLLAAVREGKRSLHLGWLWAASAAIAAAIAVFAIYYPQLSQLPQPPNIEAAKPPVLAPIKSVPAPDARRHPPKPAAKTAPLVSTVDVRQEVFPTPVPLSEQERLLLRYLAGTPRSEVANHAHEDEPEEAIDLLKPQTQRLNKTEVYSTQ